LTGVIERYASPMREDQVKVALFMRGLPPVLGELQARVLDGVAEGALQNAQA
jgi:hypothetical protein